MRLRDVQKTLNYDVKRRVVDQKASLPREKTDIPSDWQASNKTSSSSNYLIYLAIGTIFFFVIAVGIAYFVRFVGIDREVSASKITILSQGPTTVDSGSAAPITIRIANGNPVPIEDAVLSITYPDGTYEKTDALSRAYREEFSLGFLETGEVVSKNIAPILYGIDSQQKQITYELQYRAQGASQKTVIKRGYDITVRTTPVLLSDPVHTTPVPGKEVTFGTTIQSNMNSVIAAVYVQVSYPSGFDPKLFSHTPLNPEGTLWKFSSLKPHEQRNLWVKGIINGQEREEQALVVNTFVAPTGVFDDAVQVAEKSIIFALERSFIDIDISLNGRRDETVTVSPGNGMQGQIQWENVDREKIQDLVITVHFSGNGLDESSIVPGSGYFDGPNKRIVWDQQQIRSFSSVRSGGGGQLTFSFRALPDRPGLTRSQRNITVSVSAEAFRVETGAVEVINQVASRRVSLRGMLQVAGNTLFTTGSFKNGGPLPPQVGEQTSYTLKYVVKNSGNPAEDFAMTIPLARNVAFAGTVSGVPIGSWSYDRGFNEVTVQVPAITATGSRSSRTIELQVVATPTDRDRGRVLVLAERARWRAQDVYVNEVLSGDVPRLTTKIASESFEGREGEGIVTTPPR